MQVEWDDTRPYQFLREFGTRSTRLFKLCASAIKRSNLQFRNVAISDIVRKGDIAGNNHYTVHEKSVNMYRRRIQRGEKVGTLFCRAMKDNKWFLKDGNHRFLACQAEKVEIVRIAYDEENRI